MPPFHHAATLRRQFASRLSLFLLLAGVVGCSKEIGDPCRLSVDCGVQGDRTCDTSQAGGYCTQVGCTKNGCPDEAGCFLFRPRLPGCGYDDREPARTSIPYCMYSCDSDSDCRDGYVCADVTQEPWRAVLLDDEEPNPKVCITPATRIERASDEDAAICQPTVPGADLAGDAGSP